MIEKAPIFAQLISGFAFAAQIVNPPSVKIQNFNLLALVFDYKVPCLRVSRKHRAPVFSRHGSKTRHSPANPSSCLQISCLDGEGTGLFPTRRGLYDMGVLNMALFSDFGVQALFNRACAGDVGVAADLNTLSVELHGV